MGARTLRLLAVAAVAGAGAAGIVAFGRGELSISLVLVVPVLTATGPVGGLALLLAFAAVLLGVASVASGFREVPPRPDPSGPTRANFRHGGVLLLGPIPIVWGSDPRTAVLLVLLALALALVVAFVLLR